MLKIAGKMKPDALAKSKDVLQKLADTALPPDVKKQAQALLKGRRLDARSAIAEGRKPFATRAANAAGVRLLPVRRSRAGDGLARAVINRGISETRGNPKPLSRSS